MTDDSDVPKQDAAELPELPLSREALYKLVWSEPMLKVVARYKFSSIYMSRVC